jgi:hypothetical protein
MAVSVGATKFGPRQSIARAVTCSTAAAASVEIVTVYHKLNQTPDKISALLRSTIAVVSAGTPALACVSYDQTTAVFHMAAPDAGAARAVFDIVCEKIHSLVR